MRGREWPRGTDGVARDKRGREGGGMEAVAMEKGGWREW